MIIPFGNIISDDFYEKICEREGKNYLLQERNLIQTIEATVTRGRGYIEVHKNNIMQIPFSENPMKDKIDPEIWCARLLECDKYPNFMEDLREGHPEYSEIKYEVINLNKK